MPRSKPTRIEGQFIAHRLDMLESEAWTSLSFVARRMLDRLEIEHGHHGGKQNGALPCQYDDFAAFGIRRQSVMAGLDELKRKGFIEVTRPGRGGNAEWRLPTLYRLTYLPTAKSGPTDDWREYRCTDGDGQPAC